MKAGSFVFNDELLENLKRKAAEAHREIWARFMSPDCLIYDYAGPKGEVLLPTPEECDECKPNALGWWSPIEDCAFFSSDYMTGLCRLQRLAPTAERALEIRRIFAGLLKLQDVCSVDGMIARGLGADGKCHPRASSNDQVVPWLLALRELLKSDLLSESEKADCKARMLRLLKGLQAANWQIPGEGEGFFRGSFLHVDGLEGRLSSVHFVFAAKLFMELGEPDGEAFYRRVLNEPLSNGKTRLQIIEEGDLEFGHGQAWFTAHTQYAVRELLAAESEPLRRKAYAGWLRATARLAALDLGAFRSWSPEKDAKFTPDWRVTLKAWKPQTTCSEAALVSGPEAHLWHEASPAVARDKSTALWSLPSAWMVLLSEDSALIEASLPEIVEGVLRFDCAEMRYAALFFIENVVGEILEMRG